MFSPLAALAVAYLILAVLAALFQRSLIYFPMKDGEERLLEAAGRQGLLAWRDAEGRLIGWRTPAAGAASARRARLVVFHGNAGYALHRIYYVEGFRSHSENRLFSEIFLFEYPGYGARPGPTGESAVIASARSALSELRRDDAGPIYLLGESLGSGVAARLAAENPSSVAGLILVTPLTCLADVAAAHYWFFPVRLLLRDKYEVQRPLESYPGPVVFLMAGRDEIVPARLGRRLFERYSGRKKLWTQPQAGHNTLDLSADNPWWSEVETFLAS
jgi:hypothetical protein